MTHHERRTTPYDAVIIGGGHNGLTAACYLAKAGHSVCVLERYHDVGGAAFSEEVVPGYIFSTGSYVLSLAPQKVLNDLDLWEHGLELLERSPRFFMPFPDGQHLIYYNEEDKLVREITRFSHKDAAAFAHFGAFVERGCQIMDRFILRRPPSFAEFAAAFDQPGDAHVFQKLILGSSADIAEYFFENPYIQAGIATGGLIGTFRGPRDAGTGYVKLYHSMGMATGTRGRWAYVRGAMGGVTQAMKRVALKEGVTIRTGTEVEQVIVRDGTATGVALASGEEISGKTVLSNADPKRTYLKLVERKELPERFVRDVEAIQIESPVMKLNLAMEELPRFTALERAGLEQHWGQTGGLFIGPTIDYMQRAVEDARQGRPSDYPFMNIHSQSAVDRTVAPEGKHTLSIFAQYYPYELAEGTWDERRDEIAQHLLKRFAEYAPNVLDSVVGMQVLAPPDIEARFGLTGGHIFQGELVPEQAFDMRPVPGSTSYEGPIRGLYLCGSGAWPGGCVMGAPGHNAAHEAISNLAAGRHG
jgi:phytoene dehydrogenase-like protein